MKLTKEAQIAWDELDEASYRFKEAVRTREGIEAAGARLTEARRAFQAIDNPEA